MIYNRECVTCRYLAACGLTSVERILSHFVCDSFEEVENEVEIVKARCDIINLFGRAGLVALAPNIDKRKPPDE